MHSMKKIAITLFHGTHSDTFCFVAVASLLGILFVFAKQSSKFLPTKSYANVLYYFLFLSPFIFVSYYSFPGIYTIDSISQLLQARALQFNDWHPPILSALWAGLIFFFKTPTSCFWLEFILFWSGLTLFYTYFLKNGCRPLTIYLLSLCMLIGLNLFGVLMKDIVVAGALLAAFGLSTLWKGSLGLLNSGFILLGVFILSFLAVGSRHNALPAIVPLIFFFIIGKKLLTFKSVSIAVILSAMIGAGQFFIVQNICYKFLNAENWNIQEAIMIHDLAVLEQKNSLQLVPNEYRTANANKANIEAALATLSCEYLIYEEMNDKAPFQVLRWDGKPALRGIWLQAILRHPADYFFHRLEVFMNFLGLWHHAPANHWFSTGPSSELTQTFQIELENRLPRSVLIEHVFMRTTQFLTKYTPFYLGWFWVFLAIVLLTNCVMRIKQDKRFLLAICLISSGLLYILPYFFIVPCPNYRYYYWTIISTILGGFILLLPSSSRDQPKVSHLLNG